LKNYVAARLGKPGERLGPSATAITFGVSAFWHGIYPGYIGTFFFAAVFLELSKDVYRSRILF